MTDNSSSSYDVLERFTERWPEAGDRLLSPSLDEVRFPENASERTYRLLRGYKWAGDLCVQNAIRGTFSDRESLMFPALFNYRHYIELALKDIIEEHGAFAGLALGNRGHHRLPDLWQMFIKIAVAFGEDPSGAVAMAVGACIDELATIDQGSTAFRYSRKQNGDLHTLPQDGLDLARLHDVMNGIENFFESAELGFKDKAEHAAAAQRDSSC